MHTKQFLSWSVWDSAVRKHAHKTVPVLVCWRYCCKQGMHTKQFLSWSVWDSAVNKVYTQNSSCLGPLEILLLTRHAVKTVPDLVHLGYSCYKACITRQSSPSLFGTEHCCCKRCTQSTTLFGLGRCYHRHAYKTDSDWSVQDTAVTKHAHKQFLTLCGILLLQVMHVSPRHPHKSGPWVGLLWLHNPRETHKSTDWVGLFETPLWM